jgi:protein-S-isoprenylcysteine O-methyltransferase Ste14
VLPGNSLEETSGDRAKEAVMKVGKTRSKVSRSVVLTLLALAIVFAEGLTFVSIEFERLLERTLTPVIQRNFDAPKVERAILSDVDGFMSANHVRLIGGLCLAALVLLIVVGFIVEKKGLVSLGGIALFLPTYGYFVIHMSFLAGLGVLKALWLPFWGNLVKLGDVAYLPYMILVYPFALVGIDLSEPLAHLTLDLGLLIFTLGTLAWFYARFQKKGTADFWLYRFSRHPQYLGWIMWSYGLMLRAAQRTDVPLWNTNPGASLPWLISTLAIVCIALGEEIKMKREHGKEYETYRASAPFMLPLPKIVSAVAAAPIRLLLKKDRPENRWELLLTFVVYTAILVLLSLPFVLLDWPPGRGWMDWPSLGQGR